MGLYIINKIMKVSFAVACLLGFVAAEEPVWSLESVQNHRTDSTIQKAYGDHSTDKANARPPYQSAVQLDGKDEKVWQLSSVLGHRDESTVQKDYGDFSTTAANGRPPYKSTVQLESDSESSDSESDDEQENVGINADKVVDKNPIYNAWESVKDGAPDGKYERVITPHFASDSDDIFMRSMITKYAHEKRTPIRSLMMEPRSVVSQLAPSGWPRRTCSEPPRKSWEPTRDSQVMLSAPTSTPTSTEPGATSM